MMENEKLKAITRYLADQARAKSVEITRMEKVSGGAVQENWCLDATITGGSFEGTLECVLRCDSPTAGVAISHDRTREFALLKAVFDRGVTVPEPLWLSDDKSLIGSPFFIMRRIDGTAEGHVLVRDDRYGGDRQQLTERLGAELARIHSITPPSEELDFLVRPAGAPAQRYIESYRAFLDAHHSSHPALEWGLRWLERNAPDLGETVLCHRDYRTGNYMVDSEGLTGILDWEFAAWSDPHEDLGWFCARCWRFGQVELEAGGIGLREDFYRGYERESGRIIDLDLVRFWEVMAHVTWAIIAIQQAERHMSGKESSLLLALTGHIVPELEWEILNMTEAA
jgi:aminoglycoside phosphotransferase (APT) family kinase protein